MLRCHINIFNLLNFVSENDLAILCLLELNQTESVSGKCMFCTIYYMIHKPRYLANIFRGRIEYELIYSSHLVDYSVHIR